MQFWKSVQNLIWRMISKTSEAIRINLETNKLILWDCILTMTVQKINMLFKLQAIKEYELDISTHFWEQSLIVNNDNYKFKIIIVRCTV